MANPLEKLSSTIGRIFGTDNNDAVDSAQSTLDDIERRAQMTSGQNKKIYGDYLDQMQGLYGEGAQKYSKTVQDLADAIGNYSDFSYDKTVDDFADPAREMRARQAMDAIEASSSAGGGRFSSNYLDKLAQKQQALASEEWQASFDRLMRDRQQQLQEWQTGQRKIENLGTLAGLYGGDRTQIGNALGDYYTAMGNQNNADLQVYSDVAQNKANLETQRTGGLGSLIGAVAPIIGAIAK